MAIRWDPPSIEEIIPDLEDTSRLTVCAVRYMVKGNTLFLNIPTTFPDYDKLDSKKEVYFADVNDHIFLSLVPITAAKVYTRRIQAFGKVKLTNYFRIPIPIQLRKAYRLDNAKNAHLIQQSDKYECIFI